MIIYKCRPDLEEERDREKRERESVNVDTETEAKLFIREENEVIKLQQLVSFYFFLLFFVPQ